MGKNQEEPTSVGSNNANLNAFYSLTFLVAMVFVFIFAPQSPLSHEVMYFENGSARKSLTPFWEEEWRLCNSSKEEILIFRMLSKEEKELEMYFVAPNTTVLADNVAEVYWVQVCKKTDEKNKIECYKKKHLKISLFFWKE